MGDDEREPIAPVVILRRTLSEWIVVRAERQERYTDRVELVMVRQVHVVPTRHRMGTAERGLQVHGDGRVELEHSGARERYEGGESLSKAGIGELADGVDVTTNNFLEADGEALGIHVAGSYPPNYARRVSVGCEEVNASRTYA